MVGGDVANAAHVGREMVDFIDAAGHRLAVFPAAQINPKELVGGRWLETGRHEVRPPHPISSGHQVPGQVVSDEARGSRHENTPHLPSSSAAVPPTPLAFSLIRSVSGNSRRRVIYPLVANQARMYFR